MVGPLKWPPHILSWVHEIMIWESIHSRNLSNIPSKLLWYKTPPNMKKQEYFNLNALFVNFVRLIGKTPSPRNLTNWICHKLVSFIVMLRTMCSISLDSKEDWGIWTISIQIFIWLGFFGRSDPMEAMASMNLLVDLGATSKSYFFKWQQQTIYQFLVSL